MGLIFGYFTLIVYEICSNKSRICLLVLCAWNSNGVTIRSVRKKTSFTRFEFQVLEYFKYLDSSTI